MRLNQRLQRQGLSEGAAASVCLDFDLAAAHFGRWVDKREKETREVPVSSREKKRRTRSVPKYPTLNHVLGIAEDAPTTRREPRKAPEATPAIEQKVDELRRDPAALIDFLRLNGEA